MSELDYLELVDSTARRLVGGKKSMSDELEPILKRLGITETGWVLNIKSQSTLFRRVIGKLELIKDFAASRSRSFFHGLGAAKRVFA